MQKSSSYQFLPLPALGDLGHSRYLYPREVSFANETPRKMLLIHEEMSALLVLLNHKALLDNLTLTLFTVEKHSEGLRK